ncbi:formate dehydrogenase subunit delta [Undibacterium macrobrachii]|jgi:formate dehydrogenase subunit delta|uniref:Formate dehydrogenase n=1 Tax=Undibacterium macrobrachii TaxID=1119058 RepID=A0ABQ2XM94_9BURK|nr:formate dehydrogenase subunit delta [Undibacterium macrobrachii]GGX22599.1 hypothetical protein GCM10011282_30800 [Undibacterium macrobrachii]
MNTLDKLVKMANQIGTFFESFPDREEALDGIANHLKKFWTPHMRDTLIAGIESHSVETLNPIVTDAIIKHRASMFARAMSNQST